MKSLRSRGRTKVGNRWYRGWNSFFCNKKESFHSFREDDRLESMGRSRNTYVQNKTAIHWDLAELCCWYFPPFNGSRPRTHVTDLDKSFYPSWCSSQRGLNDRLTMLWCKYSNDSATTGEEIARSHRRLKNSTDVYRPFWWIWKRETLFSLRIESIHLVRTSWYENKSICFVNTTFFLWICERTYEISKVQCFR